MASGGACGSLEEECIGGFVTGLSHVVGPDSGLHHGTPAV